MAMKIVSPRIKAINEEYALTTENAYEMEMNRCKAGFLTSSSGWVCSRPNMERCLKRRNASESSHRCHKNSLPRGASRTIELSDGARQLPGEKLLQIALKVLQQSCFLRRIESSCARRTHVEGITEPEGCFCTANRRQIPKQIKACVTTPEICSGQTINLANAVRLDASTAKSYLKMQPIKRQAKRYYEEAKRTKGSNLHHGNKVALRFPRRAESPGRRHQLAAHYPKEIIGPKISPCSTMRIGS
ncbi:unnamed protein product, partial [Mesorhabditis spiculigera]